METEHVLKIVKYIVDSNVTNKESHFETRFAVFKKKYPQLYKKACTETDFDMDNLRVMLNMINSIQSKEKEQFDAETLVGQMLYDKYIAPMVTTEKQQECRK